jgi:cyclopropane-fatty-acyl-phospholipid synthase
MAERGDIDFSYSLTDRVIRLSLGELADFSGAKYDGDFNLSLEQAQRRKHEYVASRGTREWHCSSFDSFPGG